MAKKSPPKKVVKKSTKKDGDAINFAAMYEEDESLLKAASGDDTIYLVLVSTYHDGELRNASCDAFKKLKDAKKCIKDHYKGNEDSDFSEEDGDNWFISDDGTETTAFTAVTGDSFTAHIHEIRLSELK